MNLKERKFYKKNLAEVLHIKACKIAELKKTNNGKQNINSNEDKPFNA